MKELLIIYKSFLKIMFALCINLKFRAYFRQMESRKKRIIESQSLKNKDESYVETFKEHWEGSETNRGGL